eukprot:s29_g22.t1
MDTFKTLTEAARAAGVTDWLPLLVESGLTNPSVIVGHGASAAPKHMPSQAWQALRDELVLRLPAASRGKGIRKDHPVAQPSTGGSLQRALAAAATNEREVSLRMLQDDVYSQSNSGPQVSRMRTWRQIAAAWGLPALPLTPELIKAVGASFKRGGYRSSHLYFGTAKKEHILQFGSISQDLEVMIKDVIRSVERGQGPSKLKDSFNLRDLAQIDLNHPTSDFQIHYHMVVLGCFFLTREIELSATLRRHIRMDDEKKTVSWTLPATKTCTQGELTERTHKCLCRSLPAQLCPYHCMTAVLALTREAWEHTDDGPLFLQEYDHMTKPFTIECIREVLTAAHIQTQRQGTDGLVERFHGHCLRISGSQALVRLGFSTTLIMLLGRWGSNAIFRYIQDSPLHELIDVEAEADARDRGAPAASLEPEVKKLKSDQKTVQASLTSLSQRCDQLAAEVAELNTTPPYIVGSKAHKVDPRERELPPMHWSTKCGWRYGFAKFTRSSAAHSLCRKCFQGEGTDLASSGEDSRSSSTSSDD